MQRQIDYKNSEGYIQQDGQIASSANDVIPKLGTSEHSIFDRRFKMRLRSKESGKVVDINFTFKEKK